MGHSGMFYDSGTSFPHDMAHGQSDMASQFKDQGSFDNEDMSPAPFTATLSSSHSLVAFARAVPSYRQTRHISLRHGGPSAMTLAPLRTDTNLDSDVLTADWVRADGTVAPALTSSLVLEAGEVVWLRLVHTARDQGTTPPDETARLLELTVMEHPDISLTIDVLMDVDRPCLDVSLDAATSLMGLAYRLELGALDAQEVLPQGFSLNNCGSVHPVQISDLYVSRNPYGLIALPMFERDVSDDIMLLPPGKVRFVELIATPPERPLELNEPFHVGQLTVLSDAVDLEAFDVTLQASATAQTCPRADARVTSADSQLPATLDQIDADPLDTVRIEALINQAQNPSVDTLVNWSIISRPVTSHTSLRAAAVGAGMPSSREELARELFLDVPGEYIVELETFALGEQVPCQSDLVFITATPDHDLYISTTWETPLDTDPDDRQGADLDLHYLHPDGSFEGELYDVFWRNRSADWGQPGAFDDPALLRDDRDGFGPEVVAHDAPEQGKSYRIGVHYFDPAGFGSSYVSTTIHIRGQLAATSTSQQLPDQGAYLRVGQVTWSTPPQVSIDNILMFSPPQ